MNTDLQQEKSSSQKRQSKNTKGKQSSKISIEDARRNWPFTRLDGALLEKLHKQLIKQSYEDAPI
jgi:hypothetical protein